MVPISSPPTAKLVQFSEKCMAAFLALHLTKRVNRLLSRYVCLLVPCRMLSSISITLQGLWAWLADHDLDGDGTTQLSFV